MTDEQKPLEPVTYRDEYKPQRWWQKFSIHRPGYDILTGFCVLLIAIHLVIELQGGMVAHHSLYTEWFGLSVNGMTEFRLWQLFTYSLLHGNWLHLLMNLTLIWLIGGRLMVILGQKKMFLTLVFSIIGGGVFFLLFDLINVQHRQLVGASGGAIGFFILMAMLDPYTKLFPIPVKAINMAIGILSASLMLALIDVGLSNELLKSAGVWVQRYQLSDIFTVAHACHLGGGIVGLWMSKLVLGKIVTLEQLRRERVS